MKTTKKSNISLAQSLAKEKSRNEKLMAAQQELIASRNEALMRLNETEASFDRMGMVIKKGIRQLHEMAISMENLFADISRSQKRLRESANARSSLRTKVHRKRALSGGTSKTQTVNPMVGGHTIITHPRISLSRIDDFQENLQASDQGRRQDIATPVSVSAIEEFEATNSDTDSSDDEGAIEETTARQTSLPQEPQQHRETMREFYERAYAQDAQEGPSTRRSCRRQTRPIIPKLRKPPCRYVVENSSSDDCDSNHPMYSRCASINSRASIKLQNTQLETVIQNTSLGANSPLVNLHERPLDHTRTCKPEVVEQNISTFTEDLNKIEIRAEQSSMCTTLVPLVLCNTVSGPSNDTLTVTPQSPSGVKTVGESPLRSDSPDFLGFSSEEARNYESLLKKPRRTKQSKSSTPTSASPQKSLFSSNTDVLSNKYSKVKTTFSYGLSHRYLLNSLGSTKDNAFSKELNSSKKGDSSVVISNSSPLESPTFSEFSNSSLEIDDVIFSKTSENSNDDFPKSSGKRDLSSTPTKSSAVLLSNINLLPTSASQTSPTSPNVSESTSLSCTPTKSCTVLLSNIDPLSTSASQTSPKVYESTILSTTPTKSCAVLSNIDPLPTATSQISPTSSRVESTSPSSTPTKSCAVLLSNIDPSPPATSQISPTSPRVESTSLSSTPTKSCAVLLSNIDPLPPATSQISPTSPKVSESINYTLISTIGGQSTQLASCVLLEHLGLKNHEEMSTIAFVPRTSRSATSIHSPVKGKFKSKSPKECSQVLTVELKRLPSSPKSEESPQDAMRTIIMPLRDSCNAEGIENSTTELSGRLRRPRKRCFVLPHELRDTPSRLSNKIANVEPLEKKMDVSEIKDFRMSQDEGGRRALRKIAPTNYKETPTKSRMRRPPIAVIAAPEKVRLEI